MFISISLCTEYFVFPWFWLWCWFHGDSLGWWCLWFHATRVVSLVECLSHCLYTVQLLSWSVPLTHKYEKFSIKKATRLEWIWTSWCKWIKFVKTMTSSSSHNSLSWPRMSRQSPNPLTSQMSVMRSPPAMMASACAQTVRGKRRGP